jgi:signal transduction histidine kinase/ActR/RegA family two-component response regulator
MIDEEMSVSHRTANDPRALQRRDEILSAVAFVANAFLLCSDWPDAMDAVLERLGNAVGANRAYYFQNHTSPEGVELTSQRAEWAAEEVSPQIDNRDLQDVPWVAAGMERWLRLMKDRKPVYGLIADFPESEREILESQQIQSLIVMPVFVKNRLSGFLGFDDCETLREWSAAEIDALLTATTVLGGAMERQQLEDQLRFAQKMEAVGSLAAGVAHDFNNMLQAISAFTSIAKDKIAADHAAHRELNKVLAATEHANCLTRQLLTFSRKQESKPTNIDLNELCRSVITMIRPVLGSSIDLSEALPTISPVIHADSGFVSQVLLNLCLNARDSMPDGGRMEITCGRHTIEVDDLEPSQTPAAGDYAIVSIKDSGVGIDPELREKIFEPFFTTKQTGEGTGLGLSVAYGSVKQCGGHIEFFSEPGKGTQFDVLFPLVQEPAPVPQASEKVPRGTETILLVDDEPLVLRSTQVLIESLGYRVLIATDGDNGLQVFEDHAEKIDLVITDSVMPGMDGFAFREAVLAIDRQMKVIMLSGYSTRQDSMEFANEQGQAFLPKPFRQHQLAATIRDVLDSGP